jgi:Family of unknown function (DUF6488)
MKNFVFIAALIATLTFAPAAFAGGGGACYFHGHAPVKEAILVGCATDYKDSLDSKGKIDLSWKGVKLDKAETVEGKKNERVKIYVQEPYRKEHLQAIAVHVLYPDRQLHCCQLHRKVML